jgi:hypothetical protein
MHIRYEVLASPADCHWSEHDRIQIRLGHNRWPAVPEVQDPDSSP